MQNKLKTVQFTRLILIADVFNVLLVMKNRISSVKNYYYLEVVSLLLFLA